MKTWKELEMRKHIIEGTKEFIKKNGLVTVEMSIHENEIQDIFDFINRNITISIGKWIAMRCETCVEHHGKGYVHLSLEKDDMINKMTKTDNFIVCNSY